MVFYNRASTNTSENQRALRAVALQTLRELATSQTTEAEVAQRKVATKLSALGYVRQTPPQAESELKSTTPQASYDALVEEPISGKKIHLRILYKPPSIAPFSILESAAIPFTATRSGFVIALEKLPLTIGLLQPLDIRLEIIRLS